MRSLLSSLLLATTALSQTEWRDFGAVARHAMAYDATLLHIVRFGGQTVDRKVIDETWIADPTDPSAADLWVEAQPANSPAARKDHAMVYADHTQATYLFGGQTDTGMADDLWQWTGMDWTNIPNTTGPSPRAGHAMAYDPFRQRVVLFGGRDIQNQNLADTWEFDGTQWLQLAPVNSPPPEWLPGAMAFNPITRRVTLYPGDQEVWEWDGIDWTLVVPTSHPTPLGFIGQKLCTDPQQRGVLLVGGEDGSQGVSTTGSFSLWDGTDWSALPAVPNLGTERYHAAATSTPTALFVHGGVRREELGYFRSHSTWAWDGTAWFENAPQPMGRDDAQLIRDAARGQLLLITGRRGFFPASTPWARSGRSWSKLPAGPDAFRVGLAYDRVRQRVVLHGGCGINFGGGCAQTKDETWEWDGTAWSQQLPAQSPGPRYGASMAYNPTTQTTILFGGTTGSNTALTDTWSWDGIDWTLLQAPNPPTTTGPMVFDPTTQSLVMATSGQLWQLSTTGWSILGTLPGANLTGFTIDPDRQRLVLFDRLAGTYEWVSGTWQQRNPQIFGQGGAFDWTTQSIITFGAGGAYEYGAINPAQVRPTGPGCSGPQGTPALRSLSNPWIGETWKLEVTTSPTLTLGCLGFNNTTWQGVPLPLDLSGQGMPGCTLYQDVEHVDIVFGSSWSLQIPHLPVLIGTEVWLQALIEAPGANGRGFVVSDGVVGLLGGGVMGWADGHQ